MSRTHSRFWFSFYTGKPVCLDAVKLFFLKTLKLHQRSQAPNGIYCVVSNLYKVQYQARLLMVMEDRIIATSREGRLVTRTFVLTGLLKNMNNVLCISFKICKSKYCYREWLREGIEWGWANFMNFWRKF